MAERRIPAIGLAAALMLAPTALALAGPDVEQWRTDNGARVLYVHAPEIPLVDARVTFDAGSARDGDHPGSAHLASNLLMSGTSARGPDAIARALERHGADVSTGAERDMAWIKLRSLRDERHLRPVAQTVAAVLREPAFAADEIERLKRQQRTALDEQEQSPGQIAKRLFWAAAYPGHPYGHHPLGSRDSIAAIERADLRAFHDRYYVAANATVAIVGSLERARARTLAQTLVGDLAQGQPAPALAPTPELDGDRTIRESFPSTQAHVVVGRPAVSRGDTDWPALYIANHVLGGGGFTSRLFTEVREAEGLVYSVYSHATPMAAAGPFRIGFQTRGDRTERALSIVRAQLSRLLREGPTDDEIEAAKRNIGGSFPLEIDSNDELVGYLSMMGFYGLRSDYLDYFPEAIDEAGRRAAHRALRERVGSAPRVTVIVGGDRGGQAGP
jgi:zinc protease